MPAPSNGPTVVDNLSPEAERRAREAREKLEAAKRAEERRAAAERRGEVIHHPTGAKEAE